MKKTLYIALMMVMLSTSLCMAQASDKKSRWTKDMLEYKHDYIVKETNMTQAQRDKFMPQYEAMEKEIFALHRQNRELARKLSSGQKISDQDYAKAARAMAEVKAKEGEIELRYLDNFATILSKKQLFLLKQAEAKFTRQMVSKAKK